MLRRPSIERTRNGDFAVRLSADERALLQSLPGELRALLRARPDDPSLRRLFPPAYEDDEAEAEYRDLMRAELLEGRRGALETLETTSDRERLTGAELEAWLGALNDLRLVLGTQLDVTEELYERPPDPRDPRAREFAVYGYLTWLQEQVVQALAGR